MTTPDVPRQFRFQTDFHIHKIAPDLEQRLILLSQVYNKVFEHETKLLLIKEENREKRKSKTKTTNSELLYDDEQIFDSKFNDRIWKAHKKAFAVIADDLLDVKLQAKNRFWGQIDQCLKTNDRSTAINLCNSWKSLFVQLSTGFDDRTSEAIFLQELDNFMGRSLKSRTKSLYQRCILSGYPKGDKIRKLLELLEAAYISDQMAND